MADGNGNGVLAKLTDLRHNFLETVEQARGQFVAAITKAREEYLGQVVDVTLGDPKLSDVERSLAAWTPTPQPLAPVESRVRGPGEVRTDDMVPIGQSGEPDKFPLKASRLLTRCENCGTLAEQNANFCSSCATPLFAVSSDEKLRDWSRTRRR